MEYKIKQFNIPTLVGISQKQIDSHLKLYEGYVKHTNKIFKQVEEWRKSSEDNDYVVRELWRRFGFEFDGMRSHEYYFGALVDGPKPFDQNNKLGGAIINNFGSYESLENGLKYVSGTRGSGWTMLYYDRHEDMFLIGWVDEHHLGHLSSLDIIIALDCWEHAYMIDHDTTGRGKYVESYLKNLNWSVLESWYDEIAT